MRFVFLAPRFSALASFIHILADVNLPSSIRSLRCSSEMIFQPHRFTYMLGIHNALSFSLHLHLVHFQMVAQEIDFTIMATTGFPANP